MDANSLKGCEFLEFGRFRIDVRQRALVADGDLVRLPPKVFETLLALVAAPGRIVDKDDLLRTIWPDTFVEEGNLARNVSTLRKILGDGTEGDLYIETVPKRGYRFVAPVRRVAMAQTAELAVAGTGSPPASESDQRSSAALPSPSSRWRWIAVFSSILLITAAGAAVLVMSRADEGASHAVRIDVSPPPGATFVAGFTAVSPDGHLLAFVARSAGVDSLWVRSLDSERAQVLPGTENARFPFWSPDSRSLGFFASGRLWRIDLGASGPTALCNSPGSLGGAWNRNGLILFGAVADGPLMQIAATGGTPKPLTTVARERHENSHRFPVFLPDGRHFLYFVRADGVGPAVQGIYVGSLDRPEEKRLVIASNRSGLYAPGTRAGHGHLLWLKDETLVAQPFDTERFELTGQPVAVAQISQFAPGSSLSPASASEGTLVYWTPPDARYQLTWFSRDGNALERIASPGPYQEIALSPDSRRVAVNRLGRSGARPDIWLIDLTRDVPTRLTFAGAFAGGLSWSPDGTAVVYPNAGGPPNLWLQRVAGVAGERLTRSRGSQLDPEFSPDGRYLLFTETRNDPSERTRADLELLSLDSGVVKPYLQTPFSEQDGRFSPDGKYVAYTSDESGSYEVYVQSFPLARKKLRVSLHGGGTPRWRRDGRELFFLAPDNRLFAVTVDPGTKELNVGSPRALFKIPGAKLAVFSDDAARVYDVAADGQRILALAAVTDKAEPTMTMIVNWRALLNK